MGEYVIKMPDIGEGIAEAEIAEWLVAEGDEIATDQPMVEVMTDKARVEIPSPVAGTVLRHGGAPGEFVAVGAELVRLTVEGRGNVRAQTPAAGTTEAPPQAGEPTTPGDGAGSPADPARVSGDATESLSPEPPPAGSPSVTASSGGGHVLAAPAVRGRAKEVGLDLAVVRGTGPEGRVLMSDLDAHLEGTTSPGQGRRSAAGSTRVEGGVGTPGDEDAGGASRADGVEEIPIKGIRRITARRIAEAWRTIPHITIVEEVDVTELEKLRDSLATGDRPRPTVLPLLVRALVRALEDQPEFNAHFDDETETVRQFTAVHVGIATQAPDGLKVPVLRNAESLDLWQTASGVQEVSEAARDGRATREQLGGSTITITSLGKLGAFATTPIVNKPEVAIVGVNAMSVRPRWNGTAFEPRTMMNLSCSFDHRVIDGWAAATLVARLKQLLETPALIFIED
ncbi:MAG: dihydrolipoamide acetyltransferase family protein [Dermatophilus congolensis]|nr:dihydrolipoamide acetyltransferase family protein [Dermatophilus congolensis]